MCLNIGTPKTISFHFETNGKLMVLGVLILKHFRVIMWEHLMFLAACLVMSSLVTSSALFEGIVIQI